MKYLSFLILMTGLSAKAELADDLLKGADRARGGLEDHGLAWHIKLTNTEEGETSEREFDIRAKNQDAVVDASAPTRNKGEVYLINDRNMWFFKPSMKKPVPISSRQRLTGQTANGDIAATNYRRDYTPSIEKIEEAGKEKIYVLLLKAKTSNLTYDQIRYWVSGTTKLAKKAEFLTLDGVPFKIGEIEYENEVTIDGKKSPFVSKLTIKDAKFAENKSVIVYGAPKVQDFPSSLFNINRLSR